MSYLKHFNNSTNILVSIVLPVHNGEPFLLEAIDNIKRQKYHPLEIIIIDDGSTDRTAEIAAQFHQEICYIYQPNQGPSAARNHGIKIAKGEVIAFLDVDDLWADGVLIEFTDYLATHPDVDIVQGLIQRMQFEPVVTLENPGVFEPIFQPYQFINLGSAIYRKSVFDRVGLFDSKLRDNEDTDWFLRAWEQNISKVVIPKIMLFYRKHDRNMTLNQKDLVHCGLLKIYKRHIDRMRDRGSANRSPSILWSEYCGQAPD
jgi:glycosyltransferase involved in cell wall biosynthesis